MSEKQEFEVEASQSVTVKLTHRGWVELIASALAVNADGIRYNHISGCGPEHWFTIQTENPVEVAKQIKDLLS